MDHNNQTRKVKAFRAYPKNEQVRRRRVDIPRQAIREPHFIHQLVIDTGFANWHYKTLQSNKLLKPFKKIKQINSFSLYFSQFSEQDLLSSNLSLKLKSLSSLQTLTLSFPSEEWLSLKAITRLAHALGQLKRLSKLTLCLNTCVELNDECFHVLFKVLKKHRNLQYFDFGLSNCRKITDKTFKDLASILQHSLQSLEEFSLAMSGLILTKGRPLHLLATGLTSLTRLRKLMIQMGDTKISQETDCCSFLSSLQHLKSLRILDLDLSSLHNSSKTLQIFATSLRSLTNLLTLSLNFQRAKIGFVQEMEILAPSFQSLSSLENLTLDFTASQCINDQALVKLSVGLKALTKLSEITLLFDHCPQVGDVGVESIISELENLPSLNSVTLSFLNCGLIKNEYQSRLELNKNFRNISFKKSEYIY